MSKTILVTGACGWLGTAIVRALLDRGDGVIATDLAISPQVADLAAKQLRLVAAAADLGEWHQVLRLFQQHRPDAVIHAAALVGVIQTADFAEGAARQRRGFGESIRSDAALQRQARCPHQHGRDLRRFRNAAGE